MPFQIIHQDITKIRCDAIVNPTDHIFSGSGGTDLQIHRAAGPQLRAECSTLGRLNMGAVAVTKGYGLPCSYVFHTMGPIWTGGGKNEETLLRACYLNSLFKAAELGLGSIAFPLISSGTFGFPKDKVLRIALSAVDNFLSLLDTELDVRICIFDPSAFEVGLQRELEQYLSRTEPICAAPAPKAYPGRLFGASRRSQLWEEAPEADACMAAPCMAAEASVPEEKPSLSLEEWLEQQDDSFAVTLLKLIDKKHMTDTQCYKKANVGRRTFWKINNDPAYKPSKPTVIAFAIALELDLNETEALLRTVGFSLSHSSRFDMIIEFYIQRGIYDIYEINSALYRFDQLCLGC